MTEELKKYESSLDLKHSFGWTPKYEAKFETELNKIVFIPIVIQAIERLGWNLVHHDQLSVEAKSWKISDFHWGQKITISYNSGEVKVCSKSISSPLFDFGLNSKRVKLFIYALKELVKEYDNKALSELEEKTKKERNPDDYIIPETLPPPKKHRRPSIGIALIGALLLSVVLAFLIAYVTIEMAYFIGLYEVVVGFLIGFAFKYLIKISNYTAYYLNYIIIGTVLLTYILNQYFNYQLVIYQNDIESSRFIDYLNAKFKVGLIIDSIETGWIGLVVSWLFQLGFTYGVSYIQIIRHLSKYQINKVPAEVIDFAFYHLVKERSEIEVRGELTKMGWKNERDQNDVFEGIGAIQEMQQLSRVD